MKKAIFLVFFLAVALLAKAQPYTFQSAHSGAWSSPSTWTSSDAPEGETPTSADHTTILSGHTVIEDIDGNDPPIDLTGSITIDEGGWLEIDADETVPGNISFTVTGTMVVNGRLVGQSSADGSLDLDITVSGGATFSIGQNAIAYCASFKTHSDQVTVDGEMFIDGEFKLEDGSRVTGKGAIRAEAFTSSFFIFTPTVFTHNTDQFPGGGWIAQSVWSGIAGSENWESGWSGGEPDATRACVIGAAGQGGNSGYSKTVKITSGNKYVRRIYINKKFNLDVLSSAGANLDVGGYGTYPEPGLFVGSEGHVLIRDSAIIAIGEPPDAQNNALGFTINSDNAYFLCRIAPFGRFTVSNGITNFRTANELVIESNATATGSLIYNTSTTLTGPDPEATVQRYVGEEAWHFVSPPVSGATYRDLYDGGPDGNSAWLTIWNEATTTGENNADAWEYVGNSPETLDDPMHVGQGYAYWNTTATRGNIVDFKGSLTSGDVILTPTSTPPVTRTGNAFNLVGNPFSSSINLKAGGQGNSGSENIENAVWIWDDNYNGGDYRYGYYDLGNDTYSSTLLSKFLPVGQGVFVKSADLGEGDPPHNPQLIIHHEARRHGKQELFYKNGGLQFADLGDGKNGNFIRLKVTKDVKSDIVTVGFGGNGSPGFENGWDISKFFGNGEMFHLYLEENDGRKYSIDHLKSLEEGVKRIVRAGFIPAAEGEYSMVAFTGNLHDTKVTLEDLKTGQFQDLMKNDTYTFTSHKDDLPDRFLLHFLYSPTGIEEELDTGNKAIQIYSYGKSVYIKDTELYKTQNTPVFIYDTYGRLILQDQIQLSGLYKIPVNVDNSYLVVKVVCESGVFTEKVFVR